MSEREDTQDEIRDKVLKAIDGKNMAISITILLDCVGLQLEYLRSAKMYEVHDEFVSAIRDWAVDCHRKHVINRDKQD